MTSSFLNAKDERISHTTDNTGEILQIKGWEKSSKT